MRDVSTANTGARRGSIHRRGCIEAGRREAPGHRDHVGEAIRGQRTWRRLKGSVPAHRSVIATSCMRQTQGCRAYGMHDVGWHGLYDASAAAVDHERDHGWIRSAHAQLRRRRTSYRRARTGQQRNDDDQVSDEHFVLRLAFLERMASDVIPSEVEGSALVHEVQILLCAQDKGADPSTRIARSG